MGTKSAWTPERRARQAEIIRQTKPWEKSTGPKTEEGKAASSRNALMHPNIRELRQRLKGNWQTCLRILNFNSRQTGCEGRSDTFGFAHTVRAMLNGGDAALSSLRHCSALQIGCDWISNNLALRRRSVIQSPDCYLIARAARPCGTHPQINPKSLKMWWTH